MKLLIVTAVHEYKETVAGILHQAGVYQYSVANIHGVNNENTDKGPDNWFGGLGEDVFTESVMMLCFTTDQTAADTVNAIRLYNENDQPDFPVRAWLLPTAESI